MSVNDRVNEALRLWGEIIRLPKVKKPDGQPRMISEWELERHVGDLNTSRELDPTGVTTFMMLAGLLDEHLREEKFTWESVLLRPAEVEKKLAPVRELRKVLSDPEVAVVVDEFKKTLEDSLFFYDVKEDKRKGALELLGSPYGLAFLRRDALRSFEKLEAHQFSFGDPSAELFKYNRQIYEFWNVNSLVLAMQKQKLPHVSLVLIRDPEVELASYFVFAIANGETLTVLTDREEGAHPAFNRMSRRPDRNLERRAEKHWFPYELLDLKRVGRDQRLYAKVRSQLVPVDVDGIVLKPIAELEAEQFLWLVMVFEQIKVAYGWENRRLPELSYTGEMVVNPQVLIGDGAAMVKRGSYLPLSLPAITSETLETAHDDEQWERAPLRHNQWMVDRYAARVPADVYTFVGRPQSIQISKQIEAMLVTKDDDEFGGLVEKKTTALVASDLDLEALSPVNFGPKKKIESDRLWSARVNQMRAIQSLAVKEFKETHEELDRWYERAVRARRDFILDAVARKTLPIGEETWRDKGESFFNVPKLRLKKKSEALKVGYGETLSKVFPGWVTWNVMLGRQLTKRYECAVRQGAPAVVFAVIRPRSNVAVAELLGIRIDELPWQVRNWREDDPYTGNSILNRLDPVDWVLRDPWSDIHRGGYFKSTVVVCLSKQAFNERREGLGLSAEEISAKAPPRAWADEYDDKIVVLVRDMETKGGTKFKKGEKVKVTSVYRKRLSLASLDGQRHIRSVEEWNVNVLED